MKMGNRTFIYSWPPGPVQRVRPLMLWDEELASTEIGVLFKGKLVKPRE